MDHFWPGWSRGGEEGRTLLAVLGQAGKWASLYPTLQGTLTPECRNRQKPRQLKTYSESG